MKKQDITTIEAQPSRSLDTAKWLGVFALLVFAIAGFYYFGTYALYLRVIGLLVLTGLMLLLAAQTVKGQQVLAFFQGARSEARKVVWPTRQETTQLTLIVLVVVLIASVCLWFLDLILFRLIALLTG
ncbi:MAG TPA: preprotein translocase subunit SecE [Gammaproteobacteria bacterium]|nr:preprotein translocase subunit SecE [Gammaproteobacteria bacterium]